MWNDKITSANLPVDLKWSPPFYCNNKGCNAQNEKNVSFWSTKSSILSTLQNSSASTLSDKHTLGHRAGREQQEKGCPLEKGEFHVYLAVETQALNEERFASSTSFRFYYTIKQMRKITTQKAVAMAIELTKNAICWRDEMVLSLRSHLTLGLGYSVILPKNS